MNKRVEGRARAENVDEMVIASCLLMVGLEGCRGMTRGAELFPLHLFLLFLISPASSVEPQTMAASQDGSMTIP